MGKFAAVGDMEGTITLLKLSPSLYEPQPREKETIQEIFEREKRKEEIIKKQRLENEVRRTILLKDKKGKKGCNPVNECQLQELQKMEHEFYQQVQGKLEYLKAEHCTSEEESTSDQEGFPGGSQQEVPKLQLKDFMNDLN